MNLIKHFAKKKIGKINLLYLSRRKVLSTWETFRGKFQAQFKDDHNGGACLPRPQIIA